MGTATVHTPYGPRKLGRIRPKARPYCPRFAKYYNPGRDVAPPPAKVDWFSKASPAIQRMYLNDTYGDCVIAGKMHQLGIWSANDSDSGGVVTATDQEVLSQYQSICGPGDNGCVITDVLDVFKSKGLTAGGKNYKIDGYVSVDWTNKLEVQVALDVFGSLTIGINLPDAWTQGGNGSIWDVTNTGIVGGHDVCCVGYDSTGVQIATWGGLRTITWAAFTSTKWIEECYAQLAPLWYGSDKLAPNGIDVAGLQADLAAFGGGTIPPLPGPTPVVPPAPQSARVAPVSAPVTGSVRIGWLGSFPIDNGVAFVPGQSAPIGAGHRVGFDFGQLMNDLEKFAADARPIIAEAEQAIADFKAGNWAGEAADVASLVSSVSSLVPDIQAIRADIGI